MDNSKSQQDLINLAFRALNAYKRHKTLQQINQRERTWDKANYHGVKAHETFLELELALRAIQKGQRTLDQQETESSDNE